ncbi:hypothetical protein T484DRAFT_1756505 [Baffinella frigidus]|nr:hypothetical protein T484DRAFT_1756505 [Cryptophyta sp. CCMP2293]
MVSSTPITDELSTKNMRTMFLGALKVLLRVVPAVPGLELVSKIKTYTSGEPGAAVAVPPRPSSARIFAVLGSDRAEGANRGYGRLSKLPAEVYHMVSKEAVREDEALELLEYVNGDESEDDRYPDSASEMSISDSETCTPITDELSTKNMRTMFLGALKVLLRVVPAVPGLELVSKIKTYTSGEPGAAVAVPPRPSSARIFAVLGSDRAVYLMYYDGHGLDFEDRAACDARRAERDARFPSFGYDQPLFDADNMKRNERLRAEMICKHRNAFPLAFDRMHHRIRTQGAEAHYRSWSCDIPDPGTFSLADILGTVWHHTGHNWRDLRDGDSFTLELKGIDVDYPGKLPLGGAYSKWLLVTVCCDRSNGSDKEFWDISTSPIARVSGNRQPPNMGCIRATIYANQ